MDDKNDNSGANSEPENGTKQDIVDFKIVRSKLFNHFTKLYPQSEKVAKCNICERKLSYKSTTANLKQHLRRKHPQIFCNEPFLGLNTSDDDKSSERLELNPDTLEDHDYAEDESEPRRRYSSVWRYFRKLKPHQKKKAQCKVCLKLLSYQTSITNLKSHMENKHLEVVKDDEYFIGKKHFKKLITNRKSSRNEKSSGRKNNWEYLEIASDEDENDSNQNGSDEAVKLTSQIWAQYNHDDEEPTCNFCRDLVTNTLEDMKNHLEENHPDVLDQITAAALDATSEGDIFIDDGKTYTEVVYLEEEQNKIKESKRKQNPKRDVLSFQENNKKQRVLPKRERYLSESSDEHIRKPKKEKANSPDELDAFMSYLKVLLRKVPEQNSSKLHLDIINLVMAATQPAQRGFLKEKLNTDSLDNSQIQNNANTSIGCTSNGDTSIDSNSISNKQGSLTTFAVQRLPEDKMMPRLITITANRESEPRLINANKLEDLIRIIANSELGSKNSAQNAQQPPDTSMNE